MEMSAATVRLKGDMTHIVWDWNGTLFHDIDAVVGATNEIFQPYGLGPYDVEGFREVYTRPIWVAYERMLGRPLRDGEWEALDLGFHENYHRLMEVCQLAEGALSSLRAWEDAGRTQSLLSMWRTSAWWARSATWASMGTSSGSTGFAPRPAARRPSTWSRT